MALPHQIEKKYGGTAPDRLNKYWPAIVPSDNYGHDKSMVENFVHASSYKGSGIEKKKSGTQIIKNDGSKEMYDPLSTEHCNISDDDECMDKDCI